MYSVNSGLIAVVLFISMAVVIELGYRFGLTRQHAQSVDYKNHVNGISSSLLGILALLLGFTFSLALQRYDSRSEAVVDEANAIGTAYLRAQLLPTVVRNQAMTLLREYVDARVRAGEVNLVDYQAQQRLFAEAGIMQGRLWQYAQQAVAEQPSPVTSGLFVQAVNDLIDNFGKRDAELNRHVPEMVLGLLYVTFLLTGSVVGYATGLFGHRASFVTYILVLLIVVLVFVIVDLDRPRRGLIQVSQKSLLDLQSSLRQDSSTGN